MKKYGFVLMSVLTLLLGGFLAACTFKNAEATFSQSEVVVSLNDTINLDDYLNVKSISKNEVSYRFSNSSLFQVQGRNVVANASGKSYVYATYQNNSLSSMQIVVRKKFLAPTNFSLSESGVLSWNAISSFYENETTPTKAQSYKVEGQCVVYSSTEPSVVEETITINNTVSTNSFQLSNFGVYTLTVKAVGINYFDTSANSSTQTLYFGYMEQLEQSDIVWDSGTGVLSWSAVAGAKYKVSLDGVLLDSFQSTTSKNLSSHFDAIASGTHTVSVFVYDSAGIKIAQESESLVITKFAVPTARYSFSASLGGYIEIDTNANVSKYEVNLKNISTNHVTTIFYDNAGSKLMASLNGLASGTYEATIVATNETGNFYSSNALLFGKVYKLPAMIFSGLGNNELDGTVFNAKIESSVNVFETNVFVSGLGQSNVVEGYAIGESTKNISLTISQSGRYSLAVYNLPKFETNDISGDDVFVINSDVSSQIVVTKLEAFSQPNGESVTHSYQGGVSVLTFEKVNNATGYDLFVYNGTAFEKVDSSDYTIDASGPTVSVMFTNKIEDVFETAVVDSKNVYMFRVEAKTENDKLTIGSSATKTLELLSAPISSGSGNSTNKTYSWNAVNNAVGYKFEIFEIDKTIYNANKTTVNIDTSGLTRVEAETVSASYTFAKEGYYYVKVFALSGDEDRYVSSTNYMEEVFYIAQQLQNGAASFGFDESYKNHSGFTASSGYFVRVANVQNIDAYEVSVGSVQNGIFKISNGSESVYLLSEEFINAGTVISVTIVGRASDETLYVASVATTFSIERLADVAYSNLEIDELTKIIKIKTKTGATGGKIWESDSNYVSTSGGAMPVFDISDLSNFSLKFSLYGTRMLGNVFQDVSGKIYLDSQDSVISFSRLQTPSNLKYFNGDLTFEHAAIPPATKYYVLDVVCTLPDSSQTSLSVKFDSVVTAIYQGTSVILGLPSYYISYSGNLVTINLSAVVDLLKSNEEISGIYNQSTNISFAVYAYQNRNDVSVTTISSYYASIFGDVTKTHLVVEKMGKTQLSFSNTTTDITLSWEAVSANASVASQTKYQVYMDDFRFGSEISASVSYTFSSSLLADSTYYTFYIKASNPYYLESNSSNTIRVFKLKSLSRISLTSDGMLAYEISTSEKDFADYVEVTNNSSTTQNTSGKVRITENGNHSFKIIGKTVENSDSATYYIDSKVSTWTLAEMSVLQPANVAVTFADNLLSWNAFANGVGLSSLSYFVIFKDTDGGTVIYSTTSTSVKLLTNQSLYDSVSNLRAGNIEISVSAFLDTYSVAAGGTVYYSLNINLLDGRIENNHFLYQAGSTVKKLTTPETTEVEFSYGQLIDSQFPDIVISFIGNYGSSGRFSVYINDNDTPVLTSNISLINSKYTFTLTKEMYNNSIFPGETMTVKIRALSSTDIPSSVGSVDIVRHVDLESVKFEENGQMFSQNLVVNFNTVFAGHTVGGVILKVEYTENGGVAKTEVFRIDAGSITSTLIYDMSAFIKANLSAGGTIKVSAFAGNFSDNENKIYYLSAPLIKEGMVYNILKSVETVTKQTGGFVVDSSLNHNSTIYVVQYGASRFEVLRKDNAFYFEFPNDWENGSYNLKVFATENGYIDSAVNTINFSLNRIDRVSDVSMNREGSDLSSVKLSWNSISGATGYILKIFAREDSDKDYLLYNFSTIDYHLEKGTALTPVGGRVSYSLIEIFGKNYQKLISFGGISAFDLMFDYDVVFELITIGGADINNSHSFSFNATLKGNGLETTDISVDQYGSIVFESEAGSTYLYRFVDASATELQGWKAVTATAGTTKLSSAQIATGIQFNVEIILAGSAVNEPVSSADFIFEIDSMPITTVGNDLTFVVNDEIIKIGYHEVLPSSLAITMIPNSFTNFYAGLTEDAILNENVVYFIPAEALSGEADMQFIYSFTFMDLINGFRANDFSINVSEDFDIYFWSFRETSDISGSYVISKPYKFTFTFVNETQFSEVLKVGDLGGTSIYSEDYANTFALYNNNDIAGNLMTLGVYVRIKSFGAGGAELFSVTKFLTKEQMLGHDYFFDQQVFSINLTELFEQDDLKYMTGIFKVEFSKIQVLMTPSGEGTNYKFILSDWYTENEGIMFEFERLLTVRSLSLSAGNLYWSVSGDKASKYYVYFIQDLNGETLGQNYHYFATSNTYFNASDFVGVENAYYLAVQSISEDPYLLSSIRVFVIESSGGFSSPALVYKNQITSKISLKNGKLYIDWDENGDFYKLLTSDGDYSKIATDLVETVFASPFTFTLKQLIDNSITVRIKFTALNGGAEGVGKTFDVNAKYLLASLYDFGADRGFDVKKRLEDLYTASTLTSTRDTLIKFRENIAEKGSYGIANSSILFDDFFETVQIGNYKLDYCLIGNYKTLNSIWYSFSNINGENVLYVNEEPSVSAIKLQDEYDQAMNSYKMLIKKSQIYDYESGSYLTRTAENYTMKVYDDANNSYVFAITKGVTQYSLSLLGSSISETVTVFETNSSGVVTAGGGYLMFYLNYNDGDSLLGLYGDLILKSTYKMQIYAVGNNYSTSSKSEFFSLTLLGFGDNFSVVNGEFVWGSRNNRKTSVIYKKNTSSQESLVEIDGSMVLSRFSLNNLGYGLYDYIKFVTVGEVRSKSIFVDSEIYEINNIYKLASPKLNNNFGWIGIDDSTNIAMLGIQNSESSTQISYSDGSLYNYMLYNEDPSSYIMFSDENSASKTLYYETGTTGIDSAHSDYAYKQTEEMATRYYVSSLGTTAALNIEKDVSNYYLRKIFCKDVSTGLSSGMSVAIRSQFAQINATMLDTPQDLTVENGVLSWSEVTGKSGDKNLTLPESAEIVYKITVVQYKISNTESGQTDTNVSVEYHYYTTNTNFDFILMDEDLFVETEEKTYLKATVRALALNVTDTKPLNNFVTLMEGGYAYGNIQYADSSTYILMGNGATLRSIDRLAPVDTDSLEVVDGILYWKYTTSSAIFDEIGFFNKYAFEVVDSNKKQINGTFSVVNPIETNAGNSTNTFTIKFVENAGALKSGIHTLKVYASQGITNRDMTIKSFARTIEVEKLKSIVSGDFSITSQTNTETLDFSAYFADGNVNTVVAVVQIVNGSEILEEQTIQFNKNQYKLFILKNISEVGLIESRPEGYVTQYIVVGDEQFAKITFKVNNSLENVVYSDLSEEYLLQRSSWGEDGQISWDEENQVFNWVYDGYYSFKTAVVGQKIESAYVLTEDTVLYVDVLLQEEAPFSLTRGELLAIDGIIGSSAAILYNGEFYYISTSSFEFKEVVSGTANLSASSLFKIVLKNGNETTVLFDNGNKYIVATSSIVEPVYIVEVTYNESPDQIVRTYTTTANKFAPTIISDHIRLKVRVKLGNTNIQSSELVFNVSGSATDFVKFDLFASGLGTSESPYKIANANQFKNISKRLKKDDVLVTYTENGRQVIEADQYYFSLEADILLSVTGNAESYISGILFAGDFDGIIEGNNHKITYISSGVSRLSQGIRVSDGNVLGPGTETSTTFNYGSALFEKLTSKSIINNLNIDATYASVVVANHSLIAGIAITNNGKLNNVNLVGFSNSFVGYRAPNERIMMIYSGLVSVNSGSVANISNCKIKTSMSIVDGNQSQLIFVSGIAYLNYAVIENCVVGQGASSNYAMSVVCQKATATVQVAGIVTTNTTGATVRNCTNYFNISVECTQAQNQTVVYIAGVADLGMGTMIGNANLGTLQTTNISGINLHQGDVAAVIR